MAGPVRAYADTAVGAIGGAGDPRLQELLAAADVLDQALAAPATIEAALARWRAAVEAAKGQLISYLLARVPLQDVPLPLAGEDWTGAAGVTIDATLGPLAVHAQSPPLQLADPRGGGLPLAIGPLPPDSLSAHIDAGPVSGDGAVRVLPDGVSGLLALHLGVIEVAALASLRKVAGSSGQFASFAAVFSAGFTPGIQFGFGFQLSRVGGVIGVNRSIDPQAIASRLRDGSATEVLFPLDVGDSALRALASLEAILPPHQGSTVAGPTLRLSWLEVAGVGFCSLDIAVLIELPGPQRIVIVGVARAGIPPVLQLRLDVLGVIDFVQQLVSIDASLVDSGVLGIFTVYGDVAFRQSWGPQAYTVLSVGGFYPGFRPEPAQIPPMKRIGMHLDLPVPGIDLRCEGYVAVTSNTIQLGGYYEAGIEAGGCGAHGFLAVDAIVQFTPFHLHAQVSAGFEVEVFGLTFGGVRLDGVVDAPGPVVIHGRLTVETFLHDFSFDETFTFGSPDRPPEVPPTRAAQVLLDEEVRASNVIAVGGPDVDVVRARAPVPPDVALVSPRGGARWQQKRLPLTIPVDRIDGAPLGGMQSVTASVPHQTSGYDDLFAPGSFIDLSQAEALNRPAFEALPAGVVSAGGADLPGPAQPQPTKPEVFRKVRGEQLVRVGFGASLVLAHPAALLGMIADRDARPAARTRAPPPRTRRRGWAAASRWRPPTLALPSLWPVSEVADPTFLAWQRPAVLALATAAPVGARLQPGLPVTLHDDLGDLSKPAPFLLAGPGDVAGLAAGQVVGRRPHPGTLDAESTMLAHVEHAAPDLPWRYSPQQYDPVAPVRPWLVLVVGTPAEVALLPGGRVQLSGAELFAQHPLAASARWAHVHATPGRTFARIVSPRRLTTDQDWLAVLVPAWTVTFAPDGSSTLRDSWPGDAGPSVLPCFDSWAFRTTADPGDFAAVSRRLEPLTEADTAMLTARGFGRARVAVGLVPGTTLSAAGALMVVPGPADPPVVDPLPAPVAAAVEPLAQDLTVDGRWVLTLPRYDAPWYPGPVEGEDFAWPPPGDDVVPDGWRRQLRADPRHRGAAGLGAWIAIAWQDRISDGAARQAGAVATASQRIRHLTLGLQAAGALWRRRVPTDPVARLAVLSPLLGRMPVDAGGTALSAIDGRTPMLSAALLSSAARRVLRRRSALERAAAPGATSLPGLLGAANRCPEPPKLTDDDTRIVDAVNGPRQQLGDAVRHTAIGTLEQYYGNRDRAAQVSRTLTEDGVLDELLSDLGLDPPAVDCRPVDLAAYAGAVAAGVDPTVARPVAAQRVLATLTGLREPLLAEPDVAPEIDLPLWRFLADNAPDWLLPGGGDVPADRVLAVASNPAFAEAVLLGANVQTLGELRWRNLPITSRWTPLRRFWQRVDIAAGTVGTDVRPVVDLATDAPLWPDATDLGDVSHLADPTHGSSLVVVLHTELFRRYPSTLVYLTANAGGAVTWGPAPDVDAAGATRDYPSFSGTLTPELVFFGFDLPPSAGTDHWLVLEEPPPGYRFRHPESEGDPVQKAKANAATDGATFAAATFAEPVRVFLGNLL